MYILPKAFAALHFLFVGAMLSGVLIVTIACICVYIKRRLANSVKVHTDNKRGISVDSQMIQEAVTTLLTDRTNDRHEVSAGPEAALVLLQLALCSWLPVELKKEWGEKLQPYLKRDDHAPTLTWVWRQFIYWLLVNPEHGIVNVVDVEEGQEAIKLIAKLYHENCKDTTQWADSLSKAKKATKIFNKETQFHALDIAYSAASVMHNYDDTQIAHELVDSIPRLTNEIAKNRAWQKSIKDGKSGDDYENYISIATETSCQTCVRNLEKLLELLSVT